MNLQDLNRFIAPLRSRVANMLARAVVALVDDEKQMQLLQLSVLEGETREDVERVQNYGFTSVPLEGAEAVVLFVGGNRDHGLAVAVDDRRYRLRGLEGGEVAMFDHQGTKIVCKANGDVEITPASGAVKVNGTVDVTGDVTGSGVSLASHTHLPGTLLAPSGGGPVTGNSGGPL
jgi:phage gp45-like